RKEVNSAPGRMPATKEQSHAETADREHPNVFCQEEGGVFESGIFGHVTRNNFRFAFGHIERSAIRLHETGHEKENEGGSTPRGKDKPARHEAKRVTSLCSDNPVRRERANDHHHWQYGNDKRQLVTDHLRNGPQYPYH